MLFDCGILHYKGAFDTTALEVTLNDVALKNLEKKYLETYNALINVYLNKQDASLFLGKYVEKDSKGNYKPRDSKSVSL